MAPHTAAVDGLHQAFASTQLPETTAHSYCHSEQCATKDTKRAGGNVWERKNRKGERNMSWNHKVMFIPSAGGALQARTQLKHTHGNKSRTQLLKDYIVKDEYRKSSGTFGRDAIVIRFTVKPKKALLTQYH
ncbi:hypothetical protein Q8A67_014547 [Cirrhinus molitorella]|uniref:Uncharacterized protein n=1 Tax=Cirrhinus molitorella TaxID=172907 RepID=A0AA88PN20_9TELE|nr:hypothetical protein Q8A67_014547 [Cirrhinus molitorella]